MRFDRKAYVFAAAIVTDIILHGESAPATTLTGIQQQDSWWSNLTSVISISDLPPHSANRCSNFNMNPFLDGQDCGYPLSSPCFDYGRCQNGLTIYVYDNECSLADSNMVSEGGGRYRAAARKAGVLAETYDSACLFISHNLREVRHPDDVPCATSAPLWNGGANHFMVHMHDFGRESRAAVYGNIAMEGSPSQHSCYYRSGYDISLPHPPKIRFYGLQTTAPEDRKYFLTFRGTLYCRKNHGFEERASVVTLHDPSTGVVVLERCETAFTEVCTPPDKRPQSLEFCNRAEQEYMAYDYEDLMNTIFGLVPAGKSPGTVRVGEVLSAGAIPVFVVRDYVKPFPEQIDWPSFSFTFSPDQVPTMLETLRAVPPVVLREMQRKSLDAFRKIYDRRTAVDPAALFAVEILKQRMNHHRV